MNSFLDKIVTVITTIGSGGLFGWLILKFKNIKPQVKEKKVENDFHQMESISAVKVKKNPPKDDSVPFATTGFTHTNMSKVMGNNKPKNPPKERQNPRHETKKYNSHTFETELEAKMKDFESRIKSSMATRSLPNVERSRQIIKKIQK